jgi:tellurite resistance protein
MARVTIKELEEKLEQQSADINRVLEDAFGREEEITRLKKKLEAAEPILDTIAMAATAGQAMLEL